VRFFVAVFLSLYGDWLTTVALLVVLFQATNSAVAPAGYMLARVAPRTLGPWLGGSLTDRLSPRLVITATSAMQAVLTVSLIGAHRAGLVWAIYALVALAQFAGALGRPSHGALTPSLVGERELPRANATYWLLFNTSIFVGPAIGAALLTRAGPDLLFAIDAATFAVAALLIKMLPTGGAGPESGVAPVPPESRRQGAVWHALRQPGIRMVAVANFASGLTVTVTQALLVVAAHERFGGDAAVGYLYSSVGVGGVVGGIIALRWVPARVWTRFAVFIATVVEVVALAGFSGSTLVPLALLMLAISSTAASSFDTWGVTEIQRSAPPGLMGRYNSVIFISLNTGMLAGALWAVGTAGALHWDVAIEWACAAMLVLIGGVWIWGGGPGAAADGGGIDLAGTGTALATPSDRPHDSASAAYLSTMKTHEDSPHAIRRWQAHVAITLRVIWRTASARPVRSQHLGAPPAAPE
jgi:predicted MFS family arabinose efflux permease